MHAVSQRNVRFHQKHQNRTQKIVQSRWKQRYRLPQSVSIERIKALGRLNKVISRRCRCGVECLCSHHIDRLLHAIMLYLRGFGAEHQDRTFAFTPKYIGEWSKELFTESARMWTWKRGERTKSTRKAHKSTSTSPRMTIIFKKCTRLWKF